VIKIEFNGSGDEVRNEMLTLLGLQEPKVQIESPVNEKEKEAAAVQPEPVKVRRVRAGRKPATPPDVGWTEKEAQRLLNQIKPNAKIIITELANKPEGYRKSDLIQTLGLKETAMRGQLSSIGNALKKMGKTLSPILRDKVDGVLTYNLRSRKLYQGFD
jgi:hypothetical protein